MVILTLLLLTLASPLTVINSLSQSFTLLSYHYKSSANTDEIYPGSRNVELVVEVKYNGLSDAYSVTGCLILPEGFTITREHNSCSPAYTANDTVYEVVRTGDVVLFKYYFDVSGSVEPSTYEFKVKISYRVIVNSSTTIVSETLRGIYVNVSEYPDIKLSVIDYYWTPTAYPGSAGISLNIVLENEGNATIVNGHLKIALTEFTVKPRTVRVDIGVLDKNERVTITVGNVDISVNAVPGTPYPVIIDANLTARTDDGVIYETNTVTRFEVKIKSPPTLNLKILDFGTTSAYPSNNTRLTCLYFVFQNRDTRAINSITAILTIESPNTTFINGTRRAIVVVNGPYGYGDYITIRSDPLVFNTTSEVKVELTLMIFGSEDGAEFWVTQEYTFLVKIPQRGIDLDVVEAYWDGNRAYPGSAGKTLNIVLLNNDVVDIGDMVLELTLPQGFLPDKVVVDGVGLPHGSYTTIRFNGIDIGEHVKPGLYVLYLTIRGIIREDDGSYHEFNTSLPVMVKVDSYEGALFEVVDYGWSSGRAYTTSHNVRAYIELTVKEPVFVESIVASISLPPQLVSTNGRREFNVTVNGNYGYGQTIRLETIPINVSMSEPGIVPVVYTLRVLVNIHGSTTWVTKQYTTPLTVMEPKLNVTLVDATWANVKTSSESYGATIHVVLQSLSMDGLENIVVVAESPSGEIVFGDGRRISVRIVRGPVGYGDIVSVDIGGVEVHANDSEIPLILTLYAIATLGESHYKATARINATLKIKEVEEPLVLSRVETVYQGRYTPLLPSAKDVTIRITLLNIEPYTITAMKTNAMLPKGIVLKGIDGTCPQGVGGGGTCILNLHVDIDDYVAPGIYPVKLNLTYIMRTDTSTNIYSQTIAFNIIVDRIERYLPRPKPIEWYWGTQTPITVFAYDNDAPLTIMIYNPSRYTASGVLVKVKPVNTTVRTLTDTGYCGVLAPGTSCSNVFHLDLGEVSGGVILLDVLVEYLFTEYGVHVEDEVSYRISLRVEEYAGGRGLELVGYGWANNWPVYPLTENATYTVTLANRWPYPVSGIRIKLELPEGFKPVMGRGTAYIQGPVQSLNTFTAIFTLTVGDVEPGIYTAKILADYVLETGGPRIRVHEEHNISLIVNSLGEAVTILEPSWKSGSPEPGTYGTLLSIHIRDNGIPSINGPILELWLPEGIYCSLNNESYVRLPPITTTNMEEVLQQVGMVDQEGLEELIASMMGGSQVTGVSGTLRFSEGDIIEFTIPLNILVEDTGVYYANATLNFVDHWGNVRRINFTLPLRIMGSAKIVEVLSPKTLRIINGTGNLTLTLTNKGSSPVYNIYVYMIPKSPIALPVDNVEYVEVLAPGKPVNISFTLRYNPTSIVYGVGGTTLQYSSLPIMLTILYRDVTGKQYLLNTSTSVLLEPFIDVRFSDDVKAELRGNKLVVSGTLVNYGLSSAHSVEVRAIVGERIASSFIGDIDPASQIAFRVELESPGSVDSVKVEALYRDDYNILHIVSKTLPVERIELNVTVTTTQQEIISPTHVIVIALVALFLGITTLLLYRYLKKHGRRLEETIP